MAEKMTKKEMARLAYGEYCTALENRDSKGFSMLKYEDLPPREKVAWEYVSEIIRDASEGYVLGRLYQEIENIECEVEERMQKE